MGREQTEVVVYADQLGLFARCRNADVHHFGPDLNQKLAVAPMVLQGFAEGVKRFVILRPVGFFQGFATIRVGVGETGGATGEVTNFRGRVKIWQFTEQGVMLAATLKGLKFWRDDDLNAK